MQDERAGIENRIKELLGSELKVSPSVIATAGSSTPLLGGGIGLDSVETMALVIRIEEEFGISMSDSDMTETPFATIGSLAVYVATKRSEQAAQP